MKTISVLFYSTALVFAQGAVSAQDIDRPVAEWIDVPGRAAAITWYGDGVSLRTKRWRYSFWKHGLHELFDCVNDPLEYYNLAENPDYAETLARLHQHLPRAESPPD